MNVSHSLSLCATCELASRRLLRNNLRNNTDQVMNVGHVHTRDPRCMWEQNAWKPARLRTHGQAQVWCPQVSACVQGCTSSMKQVLPKPQQLKHSMQPCTSSAVCLQMTSRLVSLFPSPMLPSLIQASHRTPHIHNICIPKQSRCKIYLSI
jgi:hypothetical protein